MVYNSVKEAIRENVGVAIASAAAVIIVVRLSAVAGFNPSTARALLTELGVGNVLIGTLSGTIGLAALVVLVLSIYVMIRRSSPFRRGWEPMAAVLSGVIVAFIVPVGFIIVGVVGAVAGAISGRYFASRLIAKRRKAQKPRKAPSDPAEASDSVAESLDRDLRLVFALGAGILSLQIVVAPIWLPVETITVGDQEYVGYVLRDDDAAIIMLDDSRKVEHLGVPIESRFVCERTFGGFLSVLFREPLVPHPDADYPRCPDESWFDTWTWLGF